MARITIAPLGFDQLSVDDEWESAARTITESDVVAFAGLSGDFNPLHVDHEAAQRGPFRKPVAHGLLGLAIASGLTAHFPRVDTLAFLGLLEWKFLGSIAFGDTIRVVSRVAAIEPRARGRRGVVTWHRRILNQRGEVVQEGRSQTLVRSRPSPDADAGADPPPPGETPPPIDRGAPCSDATAPKS